MIMMTSTPPSSAEGQVLAASARMTDSGFSITDITLEQALLRIKEIEDENKLHRDNLREHNAAMREQCEQLTLWKEREREQFEQAKALITALKGENQDLQKKVMALEEREKETKKELTRCMEEKAHLQRQKAISEQRVINIKKQAEAQGVQQLEQPTAKDGEEFTEEDNIVFVSTSEKEGEIERLESLLASKDDTIAELKAAKLEREQDIQNMRATTKQLLKDMESQQKLKQTVEEENRSLTQKLMEVEQTQVHEMKSRMADTKREMQAAAPAQSQPTGQDLDSTLAEQTEGAASGPALVMPGHIMRRPEQQQDLAHIMQSLDAERQEEEAKKQQQLKFESVLKENEDLQKENTNLTSQVETLQMELDREKREASAMQRAADKDMEALIQQYEQQYEQQKHDNQSTQPEQTEEPSILRSQVLTLIRELDETHTKYSAVVASLHQKSNRIEEIEHANRELQAQRGTLWQERQTLIETLNRLRSQQLGAQQENNGIKEQHQQLQVNFGQLVTDFRDLEETFATYRRDMEEKLKNKDHRMSRQEMEERDHLQAQVLAAEEALARKDERLAELKAAEEQVFLHKLQLEIWQTDFQAQNRACAKLQEERANLIQEINTLRDQNRELREVMDTHNQQQMHNMQARHLGRLAFPEGGAGGPVATAGGNQGAEGGDPRVAGSNPIQFLPQQLAPQLAPAAAGVEEDNDFASLQQYVCPKCQEKFPDEDTVQLHLTECLEKD